MVTYLVGTDGPEASEAIIQYLEEQVGESDHLEVANVQTSDVVDETQAGQEALDLFETRFRDTLSVNTKMFNRGRSPTDELVQYAEEVDADELVTALRRHSRTERIIFGSVSHSLLQRTTRPITLVPLDKYQPPTE